MHLNALKIRYQIIDKEVHIYSLITNNVNITFFINKEQNNDVTMFFPYTNTNCLTTNCTCTYCSEGILMDFHFYNVYN